MLWQIFTWLHVTSSSILETASMDEDLVIEAVAVEAVVSMPGYDGGRSDSCENRNDLYG